VQPWELISQFKVSHRRQIELFDFVAPGSPATSTSTDELWGSSSV